MVEKGKLIQSQNKPILQNIEHYLNTDFIGRKIYYFNSINSTNIKAKEIALKESEGTLIIAEEQMQGKGRLGRNWTSPRGKGLWMSMILKPKIDPTKVAKITLIGAAAVHQALKDISIDSYIKWPNDIIVGDKKVCGILTEMGFKSNKLNYCIMGIGINVNLDIEDFPEELKNKATSLKIFTGSGVDRRLLLSKILNHFEKLYLPFRDKEDISKVIDISRQNSILIGKKVRIIKGEKEEIGEVLDMDDEGQLIIQFKNGNIESVFSGEVSIRGIGGYV